MHHKTQEKYLKLKDQGMTAEELKADMLANGIAEAEADKFISEVYAATPPLDTVNAALLNTAGGEQPVMAIGGTSAAVAAAATALVSPAPEVAPVAPKFDYKNLTGKEYEAYIGYIASLPLFGLRQFDCFKALPVMKERYPGMPNTPSDMVGLEITTDKPLHTTKIDIKTANELNAQLANSKRIYLLKQ